MSNEQANWIIRSSPSGPEHHWIILILNGFNFTCKERLHNFVYTHGSQQNVIYINDKYCALVELQINDIIMLGMIGALTHWGRQNDNNFAETIFWLTILNRNVQIAINNSIQFVPKSPINNIPVLVQTMAWGRPGDRPLSEPMMVSSLTHICVTRPQWVNGLRYSTNITDGCHVLYCE